MDTYLTQIDQVAKLCKDTDGILICNKEGYVEYAHIPLNYYLHAKETIGRHILELYPMLDEKTSTIMQTLKSGKPNINKRQETVNFKGQSVILVSTTLPIVVDGEVVGAVDSSKFFEVDCQSVHSKGSKELYRLNDIISVSAVMEQLKARITDAASTRSTVLIYGETGTGKELVAQSIHSESPRSAGPFLSQNCAAIPENLMESIFLGTEKGSYTGAVTKKGLFEIADGGTLFLDELNSMDLGMQAKLLKVIEEKKVRRVGGERDISVDVRIVCAMNEAPNSVLRAGRLREDLFYRISVVQLRLPPLRERLDDVLPLARFFLTKFNYQMNRGITAISELVQSALLSYSWPGNVRQLQNVMESAFNTARGDTIMIDDIQDVLFSLGDPIGPVDLLVEDRPLRDQVEQFERSVLQKAMARSSSVSDAARQLKLSRQNLQYKLEKYGLL